MPTRSLLWFGITVSRINMVCETENIGKQLLEGGGGFLIPLWCRKVILPQIALEMNRQVSCAVNVTIST